MAMNVTEFLNRGPEPSELCGCGCGKPLEMNDSLGPKWMIIDEKRVLVNEDCYFDEFSKFIDEHPIGGLGVHGPKNKCPLD